MKRVLLILLFLPVCLWADDLTGVVDEAGNISLPENFRSNYAHLGSWFVPEGDASGFHDVYTQKESVLHYQQHGEFPDGAVLVKELRAASTGNYTTGANVAYPNETIKQWFVMVKDSEGRYASNPNWGEGWGWALFTTADQANTSKNFRTDCLACHIPARQTDWIYVEAYPTLTQD